MTEIRPEQIILATDAFLGHWARAHQTAKKITDASATFYFADDDDVNPLIAHQTRVGQGKHTPGKRFRLVLIEVDDDEAEPAPEQETPKPYGQYARELKRSGFFRRPDVWRVIGTDEVFRHWVSYQPSIVSGQYSEVDDAGDGRCVACHVRRAGEAGTAFKPEYACVPMTDAEHKNQHQEGELFVFLSTMGRTISEAHDLRAMTEQATAWFDKKRIETVERWAWEALKLELGYDSMAAVPPDEIYQWADAEDLAGYLPACYREGATA